VRTRIALWIGVALVATVVPMLAHHSFAAEYDQNKTLTLKGTIAKVEWLNPHIWFYVDVKDDNGKVSQWQCEGGAPNSLTRNGWTKNSLKQGDSVTVDGYLAKDGKNTLNARTIKLADGRSVLAGSSNDSKQ
jgi:primosomal replication protein N